MQDDVISSFGYLTLGSRLKRLGERLQADVARLSDSLDLPVGSGQYPLIAALHRSGTLTISGLAEAVGVSQPAITRSVAQLCDAGLVTVDRGLQDQRVRAVALSEQGRALAARASAVLWPAVERAVRDLCEDRQGPLLHQIRALEELLNEEPLDRRAMKLIAREDIP